MQRFKLTMINKANRETYRSQSNNLPTLISEVNNRSNVHFEIRRQYDGKLVMRGSQS